MSCILLSIKPKYVEKILNGSKKYEYRKIKCKKNIDKIIIYSTTPIMKVVGEAKVEYILEDTPSNIWDKTNKYSGIDYDSYNKYYENVDKAVAYKLKDVIIYDIPNELNEYGVNYAPQSFVYLD